MTKDSGGFMFKHFEKIVLCAFGVIALAFLMLTLVGSYYDRPASELDSLLSQKENMIDGLSVDSHAQLKEVGVRAYDEIISGRQGVAPTDFQGDFISSPGGRYGIPRPLFTLLPPPDLIARPAREVLAYRGSSAGNRGRGGPGGQGGPGDLGSLGDGAGIGAGGDGDSGAGLGGNLGGRGGNNGGTTGDSDAGSTAATGFQPPDGSRAEVKSFVTLLATVPRVQQGDLMIEETLHVYGPRARATYLFPDIEYQIRGDDEDDWTRLDRDELNDIVTDAQGWVREGVEEVVAPEHVFPLRTHTQIPAYGFTMSIPPAVGRAYGQSMTSSGIPLKSAGPVVRPVDEIMGEWRIPGRNNVTFIENESAYQDTDINVLGEIVVPRLTKLIIARGDERQVALSTPDDQDVALVEAHIFDVQEDGTSNKPLANTKLTALRMDGDVILKSASSSWFEIYRKNGDNLKRIVVAFLEGDDMTSEAVVFEQEFEPFVERQVIAASNTDDEENANQAQAMPTGPSDFLMRLHHTTVDQEQGFAYRYRVRFALENPNYGFAPGRLADKTSGESQLVYTEWSVPTDWVTVASKADVVLGPVLNNGVEPTLSLFLREPSSAETPLVQSDVVAMLLAPVSSVRRGRLLNNPVRNPAAVDILRREPVEIDAGENARQGYTHAYRSNELIVDIRGGDRYGRMLVPGETLVLDAGGNLVVRNQMDESYDTVLALYEKAEDSAEPPDTTGNDDNGNGPPGSGGGRGGRGRGGRGGRR